MAAIGPASLDIYLPGLPALTDDLEISASAGQLTIAAFLVGIALGQLVAGPISDVYGRRRPMMASLVGYMAASGACVLAPGIGLLTAGRLCQGLTAAGGIVISRAVVRDLWAGAQGARYLSRLVLVYGMAPLLAPLVGGQMLRFTSWRGLFGSLVVFGAALLVATARSLPETLPPHARRPGGAAATREAFTMLLHHRLFIGYALVLGLGGAAMLGYISGSPFALQDVFGLSPQAFAAVFACNGLVLVASSQLNAHLVTRIAPRRLLGVGIGMQIAAGLGLVAVAVADLGLWVALPCLSAIMGAWGLIPANAMALAMTDHPSIAGAASAVLGVFQFGLAGAAAPLVGVAGRDTLVPMALMVLASGILAALAAAVLTRPPPPGEGPRSPADLAQDAPPPLS